MKRRYAVAIAVAVVGGLVFIFFVPVLPATSDYPADRICSPAGCSPSYPNGFPLNYTVSVSFRYLGYGAVSGLCSGYRVMSSDFTVSGYMALGEGKGYCFTVFS